MKTHLVAYLIVACSASLHGGSPAGKTQQLTSTDQVPEGLAKSDWSSIRAAYEAGRHAFQPVPGRDGVWQAHNPGQQWLTTFDQRGFEAKPVGGDWSWGLELKSYGFGEKQTLIGGTPTVKAAGQRLSYQWNAAVQEWWVNDQRGLEHGFTLSERPPLPVSSSPASPLAFTLGTRGNLKPKISADALEVQFQDSTGATVLNYSGLKVWDADGVILPSRFESAGLSGFRLLVDQSSARYPITIDPVAQQAYFKASQVNSGDHFGWSVAVSGDIVVVGAYQEDSSTTGVNSSPNELATDAGAAYVFVRSGSTWSQQAYLKASQVNAGDKFGWSVAVSGDTVVVGAIYEDSSTTGVNSSPNELATDAGAAYVFVRSGSTWSQQAYLKASQVTGYDQFGYSVAVSGDTVVVGAPNEDSSTTGINSTPDELASYSGAAYVFERSGSSWNQQAYLKASQVNAGDFFGWSVAVSGNTVVVGAWFEDSSTTGVNSTPNEGASAAGAAYVFVRSGSTWSQQAYLKASQVNGGDWFGNSVAVSGDTVVVGVPNEASSTMGVNSTPNELATDAGAAYVFVRSGSTWSQQAYLKASQVNAGDVFGWSVAVSGDTVVVGAIYEDSSTTGVNSTPNESAESAGAAYVFVRSSSTWSQQTYLKASQVNEFDEFGWSVAVSGNTVVVGARFEDSSTTGVNSTPNELASEAGAAYIFTGLGPTPDIAVTQAAAVADAGSTDFGPVTLGSSSAPLTFTVTNPGTADLTSLVVNKDGLNAADFTVSALSGTSVSMGGSVTFTVTFYPSTAGSKTAAIHIASNVAGAKNPFDIEVTGTGTALPEAVITVQPLSRLVLLGSAASFNPVVTGDEPMTLQWKKGTMVINGATLSTYTIPLTKTSDMGAYILTADNPVGPPVTSRPAYLGIVTPMVGTQVIKKGAALNLKATVVAPTVIGMVLRYSWRRGPDVLGNGIQPNGAVVSGADKAALSITKMGMDDAGTYSCLITLDTPGNDPQIVNGETVIRVVDAPPVMDPIPLPVTAFVGQMIDVTVSATNFPSGFQVTGLPLGLKLDVKTGRITGQPTTGSKKDNVGNFIPSKITFKATNAFGTGAGLDFFMTTQPLPAGVAGSYTGLVARDTRPGGTEELGGVVTFTVTGGSSVTGKLTLLGKQQPFTTSLRTAVDGLTGAVLARVSFPRPTAVTAALLVDMTLTVTPATRSISGELQWTGVAGTFTTLMSGWQNQTVPLVTGAGLYNSALLTHSPESDLAYPQGTGYLTLNVTPTGLATWGGKLSDNNTITGSSNLGPAGQVPVHLLLYTNTGSVQGWAQITGNDVDGTLDWFKAPQPVKSTTRSYKGGFLRHDLTVDGGKYIKPATGSILLGLPSSVQIGLTGGGLSPAINQAFTITTANVAQVPTNTNNVKVTLTATTGLFTGSFTQPGLTATTPRKADIFGAFIPSSASGVGFFNLPENPDAAGETPTNTPMHSGAMEIKAP